MKMFCLNNLKKFRFPLSQIKSNYCTTSTDRFHIPKAHPPYRTFVEDQDYHRENIKNRKSPANIDEVVDIYKRKTELSQQVNLLIN